MYLSDRENTAEYMRQIIDIMGAEQTLNAILDYLRIEEIQRIAEYIDRMYDLEIGEEIEE